MLLILKLAHFENTNMQICNNQCSSQKHVWKHGLADILLGSHFGNVVSTSTVIEEKDSEIVRLQQQLNSYSSQTTAIRHSSKGQVFLLRQKQFQETRHTWFKM